MKIHRENFLLIDKNAKIRQFFSLKISLSRRESIISQAYARAVRSRSISVPVQSERFLVVGK